MGSVINLENQTKENLDEIVSTNKLVLVDYHASWCGPCKVISPLLDVISNDIDILIVKLDIDNNNELTMSEGIKSVPTLKLYKDGVLTSTTFGMKNKQQLLDFIET